MIKNKKKYTIDPDEVFLDARNLPSFETDRFEGRLEKPIPQRNIFFFGIACLFILGIFIWNLFGLQIINGAEYTEASSNNRLSHTLIFSERGIITDKNGAPLASNDVISENIFSKRLYASMEGIAHIIGYVSYPKKDSSGFFYQTNTEGKQGAELFYDYILRGKNGITITEKNVSGKIISESAIRQPDNGKNITLSIDVRIQQKLYSLIKELTKTHSFSGGSGIILDIKTGELLTMTSFPEYNPSILADGENVKEIESFIYNEEKPFLNRAVAGLYTPGSIIKPFVALAALAEGIISPEDKIESTGSISIPHPYLEGKFSVFNDWKAHGFVDMKKALAVSSNVYFYEITGGFKNQKGIGIENLANYLTLFGFGERTGIDLDGEQIGIIPTPKWKKENFNGELWRVGDTYNTAIGQYGFQVTPIQMARGIAAVASNGILVTPHLWKNITPRQTKITAIPDSAYAVVKEGMRQAVTEGTASGLNISAVKVAAKTGTAERGADKKFVNSWVVGFFPYENPRYSFAIVMERGPRDNTIGATYVLRQLLEWMIIDTGEYLK